MVLNINGHKKIKNEEKSYEKGNLFDWYW